MGKIEIPERNTQHTAIITLQLPCRKEKYEINKAKWYFRDDFSNKKR